MIRSKIQIEDGEVKDFYEEFGFIYMNADERTAPGEKEDAVSSYAEQAGENRDGRTVDAPFDYAARFIVEAKGTDADNINKKIAAFNRAVREQIPGSDVKRKKEITFYNLNNRCKIVGYAEAIAVPKEAQYAHRAGISDFADVELKIRVEHPEKCDFELSEDGASQIRPANRLEIALEAHGLDIEVQLSRPLNESEHVVMLRKGTARSGGMKKMIPIPDFGSYQFRRRNRWQVYYKGADADGCQVYWPFSLDGNGFLRHCSGVAFTRSLYTYYAYGATKAAIRKSQGSRRYIKTGNGITYGVAVYRAVGADNERIERVSNVAYFKSYCEGMTYDEELDEYGAITRIET